MNNKPLYAVVKGEGIGIFRSWDKAKSLVNGYSNAKHKKFYSYREANDYFKENTGLWLRVADIDREFIDIEEARKWIFHRKRQEEIMFKELQDDSEPNERPRLFKKEDLVKKQDEVDDVKPIVVNSLAEVIFEDQGIEEESEEKTELMKEYAIEFEEEDTEFEDEMMKLIRELSKKDNIESEDEIMELIRELSEEDGN